MEDQNETIKLILNEIEDKGILEAMGDGISIQDTNFRVVYQNEIHKKFVGEHIGEFCYKAYEKRENLCDGCPVAKAFQDGKTHTVERSAPTERGTSYFDITASVLKGTTGEALAGIEIVRDITVHKKAKDKIRRSAEELDAILKVSQSLATTLDLENVLQMTINEAVKLTGLGTGAIYLLEGEKLHLWATMPPLPPKFPEELCFIPIADHPHIRQAITTRSPVILDDTSTADLTPAEQAVTKLRGLRTLLYVPLPVKDKVLGVFIVGSVEEPFVISKTMINLSITLANQSALAVQNAQLYKNIQRAYEDLQESEERYRRITDTITDYIYTVRVEGGRPLETKHSDTCLAVTGYTAKEFDNDPYLWIKIIVEEDHDLIRQQIEQVLSGQFPKSIEHRIIRKDNVMCWVESTVVPHYDRDKNLISYDGIVQDITERKNLDEERQKIHKLESIGIFAGGIAHDFNNILAGILNNVYLSKMHIDRETKEYEHLESAEKAIIRATNLTQQLLTFSKGGVPIKKTVSFIDIIRESTEFALKGSNVKCDYIVANDLWSAEVDEGQINQVLHNLILNADQSMPEGGTIRIHADNFDLSSDMGLPLTEGRYLKIIIQDQGIGIEKEYLQKIFDPYFTTKEAGRGLGLSIIYSIIKNHDGHISVESEIGVGATFTMYLPATDKKVEDIETVEDISVVGEGRILIMDDEAAIRESFGQLLTMKGFEIAFAKDGEEAIELYEEAMKTLKPFNGVILDLTVPGGMGGKKTIKKMLEIDPDVKAVVSSGYSNDPVMAHYKEYGFRGIYHKGSDRPDKLCNIFNIQ